MLIEKNVKLGKNFCYYKNHFFLAILNWLHLVTLCNMFNKIDWQVNYEMLKNMMNCDTFCCKNWLATAKLFQKSIYHFQLLFDDEEDGHKQYCTQQQIALFSNCYFDWNANINHSIENNLPSWTIIMYCSTSCHHHHISIIFQFYPLYLKVIQRQAPWVLIVENPDGAAILRCDGHHAPSIRFFGVPIWR